MTDLNARDTGVGSAAQGGEVHARNVAGKDVQSTTVNLTGLDAVLYEQTSIMNRVDERTKGLCDRVDKIEEQIAKTNVIMLGNGKRGALETMRAIQDENHIIQDGNRRFRQEVRNAMVGLFLFCIVLAFGVAILFSQFGGSLCLQ